MLGAEVIILYYYEKVLKKLLNNKPVDFDAPRDSEALFRLRELELVRLTVAMGGKIFDCRTTDKALWYFSARRQRIWEKWQNYIIGFILGFVTSTAALWLPLFIHTR